MAEKGNYYRVKMPKMVLINKNFKNDKLNFDAIERFDILRQWCLRNIQVDLLIADVFELKIHIFA